MGLSNTPAAGRLHIGIFGRRNAGKSSLINAITGQDFAIVSDVKGTTTDPVYKSMELLPLGPVTFIDTPGIDDDGELGAMRIKKARQVLNKTDLALLVIDAGQGLREEDHRLLRLIEEKGIPHLTVWNKCELLTGPEPQGENIICVSAKEGLRIEALKNRLGTLVPEDAKAHRLAGDLLSPGDVAVLVTPIDSAAPKGRLILPQQQTIRDILDADAMALVVKEHQLADALKGLGRSPRIVITDSQVFAQVSAQVPEEVPLTSFSILFARYKGLLADAVKGAAVLATIQDGDPVLICEGCTHHRQCDDIGTVKLPALIRRFTGKEPAFSWTSGTEFPDDLQKYKLVIHCGGCMLNDREMEYRRRCAADQRVPITNYGIAMAAIQGILQRSIAMFSDLDIYGNTALPFVRCCHS